jgi:hypothetical protein
MRALAIPTALAGLIIMWACLAPAEKAESTTKAASRIVITPDADHSETDASATNGSEQGSPVVAGRSEADWKAFIELQKAEVAAISTQLQRVREESASAVNDLLVRRQANSTLTWRGRIAELKAAQSLTDSRFQEWQDRDLELHESVARFEELSKALAGQQEHPDTAASLIGKAALKCRTASDSYRDAGTLWARAVQSECQLTKTGRPQSNQTETENDADFNLVPATTKTAAAIGQQAMRFADCGASTMDGYQDTVRFTRRVRTLKVVGPLHKVDSLSSANLKLYADVKQVANSLTKDPDISAERLAFLNNKLKTLKDQIARNTKELDAAQKTVRISYPCSSGTCSR